MRTYLSYIQRASALAVSVPSAYLGAVTISAWRARSAAPPESMDSGARTRFVILVPAHNEEALVGECLQALMDTTYDRAMFEVHVVADNCTDRTATVALAAGAHVHERHDPAMPGKGHALNWLLTQIEAHDVPFDVAVFVDADTVVSTAFLGALDSKFRAGARAVQGLYMVNEPFVSVPATLRYCALACRHHVRPLGRTAFGGSSGLFGNGMAFDREIVMSRQWSSHLVEDLKFGLDLVLDGVVVAYQPEAVVLAEMPDTLEASVTQHQRWEEGRQQILREYTPLLLRRLVRPGTAKRRVIVDALLDVTTPPLSVLAPAACGSAILSAAVALIAPTRTNRVVAALTCSMVGALAAHVVLALRMVRAPAKAYAALWSAPSLIWWKIRLLIGSLAGRPNGQWVRTERNATPFERRS